MSCTTFKQYVLIGLFTLTSLGAFPLAALSHALHSTAALPEDQQGLPDGTMGGASR